MRRKPRAPRPAKSRSKRQARAKPAGDGIEAATSGRDAATGEFRAANRFWMARRTSAGPEPLFADGEALWAACDGYFCWCVDNPIIEEQLVTYKGMARMVPVPKMRPMTKRGLCLYLGIAHTTWSAWKKDRPELAAAIERAESVIWEQKFGGAAVGIFNGNLVARELGLADKTDLGGKVEVENLEPRLPPKDLCKAWGAKFLGVAEPHAPLSRRLERDR